MNVTAPEKEWSAMTPAERKRLDPDVRKRLYQRDYYRRMRKSRNRSRRQRWRADPKFRQQHLDRMQESRAAARKVTAPKKLEAAIASKKDRATRHPRLADVNKVRVLVHTTGALAQRVGRESGTVRAWLDEGVLPGCSIVIGGKCWFTDGFIAAVREALERLLVEDARAPRERLKSLAAEALRTAGETWVSAPQRRRRK